MASLKAYKEIESKVHEHLYNNLYLLSQIYPTTSNFNSVFKKDMFVKSNKTAFYEVVYYLLITLNPERTRKMITTWPTYDIKSENKFRMELMKYINELNFLYDNADIPQIMTSHLISPGGFKFAKFMLKLSQLVISEHLKKDGTLELYSCPKLGKNVDVTKANINNFLKEATVTDTETKRILMLFEQDLLKWREKATGIVRSLTDLNTKIIESRKQLVIAKDDFNKKYPSYPSEDRLKEKFAQLQLEWDNVKGNHDLFSKSTKLLYYLTNNNLVFESKEDFRLPNELMQITKNNEEIILPEFFNRLQILLERIALELPNPTSFFINENLDKIKELKEKCLELEREFTEDQGMVESGVEKITENLKCLDDCVHPIRITSTPTTEVSDDMFGIGLLSDSSN